MRKNARRSGKHRKPRHNLYVPGVVMNRPRRRRHSSSHRKPAWMGNRKGRRRAKHNPSEERGSQFLGLTLPPLDVVGWTAAGLIAPGMVQAWITPMIPTTWTQNADGSVNQITNFAIKGASVLLPSMLVRSMVSRRGGNIMLVAGFASLALQALKTFAPSLSTQIGLGAQPMLGEYIERRPALMRRGLSAAPDHSPFGRSGVPSRLDPAARF